MIFNFVSKPVVMRFSVWLAVYSILLISSVDKVFGQDKVEGRWVINTVHVKDISIFDRANPAIAIRATYEMERLRKGSLNAADSARIKKRVARFPDLRLFHCLRFTADSFYLSLDTGKTLNDVYKLGKYKIDSTRIICTELSGGRKKEKSVYYIREGRLYQTVHYTMRDDYGTISSKAEMEWIRLDAYRKKRIKI